MKKILLAEDDPKDIALTLASRQPTISLRSCMFVSPNPWRTCPVSNPPP
ncbi:MAG: hypothetical protein SXV54_17990 [Chloroflexota bacterium]|nr:hypothetical protein [Chloroflexota bacterium]